MKQPAAPISAKAARPVRPARKRPAGKVAVAVAAPVAAAAPADSFPIVGIGASAGGLEALEQFLQGVPPASGLVFAIVQHLDPTQKGMLAELLQRCTPLPVRQITDRMPVERDHVDVIQPNRDLSILHGVLHLLEPAAPRGLRLPIDFFLRALAADRQQRSVGVILSGKGSEGTLGLRAIKERAGAVFVQSPASARFDGMPRSAIDAGLADRVAAADGLAGQIVACLQHVPLFIARPDADLRFADPQKKLPPLFHYSLSLGGVLVLGSAGATGQAGDLFDAVPGKNRICWRKPNVLPPDLVAFPSAFVQQHAGGPAFHSPARRPRRPGLQQCQGRQVPGAGHRQGQPEPVRNRPRRSGRPVGRRLCARRSPAGGGGVERPAGRQHRRQPCGRRHRAAADCAGRAAWHGAGGVDRRGGGGRNPGRCTGQSTRHSARHSAGQGVAGRRDRAGTRRTAGRPRRDAGLARRARIDQRRTAAHE